MKLPFQKKYDIDILSLKISLNSKDIFSKTFLNFVLGTLPSPRMFCETDILKQYPRQNRHYAPFILSFSFSHFPRFVRGTIQNKEQNSTSGTTNKDFRSIRESSALYRP